MYGAHEDLTRVVETRHMLFEEAAAIARAGDVDRLWLTHFSPALSDPLAHLATAQAVFPNTYVGVSGLTTTLRYPD
jgi:ribonuclease Z